MTAAHLNADSSNGVAQKSQQHNCTCILDYPRFECAVSLRIGKGEGTVHAFDKGDRINIRRKIKYAQMPLEGILSILTSCLPTASPPIKMMRPTTAVLVPLQVVLCSVFSVSHFPARGVTIFNRRTCRTCDVIEAGLLCCHFIDSTFIETKTKANFTGQALPSLLKARSEFSFSLSQSFRH